jgi:predicted nucleotide-binding protein
MVYFHVFILYLDKKGKERLTSVSPYYGEEDLKKKFAEPFNEGKTFWIIGKPFHRSEVKEVYIFPSDSVKNALDSILPNGKKIREEKNRRFILRSLCKGEVAGIGGNITDNFIAPITKESVSLDSQTNRAVANKIFIVHGREHEPVKELKTVLIELGFNPIVLHEQSSRGMTIIEKLEKYSDVGFAFTILTPDDYGFDKEQARKLIGSAVGKADYSSEDYHNWSKSNKIAVVSLMDKLIESLKERARQNVILEFGYFMGKLSRKKICCLYKGNIELPSDMLGICYVHFNESINEVKDVIIKELRDAGYQIKQ